ncbi:MAG TPA: nitroreductase/quinone reductase family protein [Candidatus Dormibacteraeota bacterium]|jgi:deazaflavin-dependent oxidoreductase (nitroreductase family)
MTDQPPARRPPEIPADMNAFNQKVIQEFRANHGELSGQMAGRKLMLLTTTGSRTGEPRTVVLGYKAEGDRFFILASANGAPSDPVWYRNLKVNPVATVEVGPETVAVRARTADPRERAELSTRFDYLEGQQAKTKREIPIVILERIKP